MKWKIIKQFSNRNTYCFTLKDVVREFPEKNTIALGRILADMVHKGMLMRITQDNYHILPINANPDTYIPNNLQIAKYLMQNKEYYIGYASALRVHKLRSPFENAESKPNVTKDIEYVVTKKQIKPATKNFEGIKYQFIQHDTNRFFGFNTAWINKIEEVMVSDVEKTIVDIATKPTFCGGIVEVGDAILQAKDRTDHDKLFYYFKRNKNKSAKKRFLYLSDLLGLKWTSEHVRMMETLGTGFSLLDPTAPDLGRKMSRFGLKINIDPMDVKKKILHRKAN